MMMWLHHVGDDPTNQNPHIVDYIWCTDVADHELATRLLNPRYPPGTSRQDRAREPPRRYGNGWEDANDAYWQQPDPRHRRADRTGWNTGR